MEALDRTKSVAASKTLEDGLLPMAGQFDDDDDEVEIHSVHTHDIMPYYYDNRAHTASITSSPVRSQRAIDTLPSTRLPSAQQACASTANGAVAIAVHRQPVEPATPITATVRARFTGDILKAAVCTTFAGCAMLCNLLTLCIIHDYVGRQALPDAVFYLVPQQSWAWRAGDPLVALMVVCTLLLCIMHRHRWVLWRRWMFLLGTLYAMRVLCLAVTQLPASFADNERSCKPKHEGTDVHVVANRFFSQLLMAGLQGNSDGYLCGDLMFSGHTLQYGVNCYMMHRYTPHAWWPVKHLSTLIAATGMVFMVISRSHYTVDVVVAYWLSTGLFSLYHAYIELDSSLRRSRHSALQRIWIMYPVRWLEDNAPDNGTRFANELEWPFTQPRWLVEQIGKWSTRWNAGDEHYRPRSNESDDRAGTYMSAIEFARTHVSSDSVASVPYDTHTVDENNRHKRI